MRHSKTSVQAISPLMPIVVFVVSSFFVPALRAQDPPDISQGTSPSAVYFGNGSFETVDMTTGRLNIDIPLLTDKSQRGNLNFSYSVPYSGTGAWEIVCDYSCYWWPSSGLPIGPVPALDGALGEPFDNYPWTVTDSSGAVHALVNLGSYYESVDASGIQSTAGSNAVVINKSGARFGYNGSYYIEDPNGNLMTFPGGTGYADFSTLFSQGVSWTMDDTVGRPWSLTANANPASNRCPNTSTAASLWSVPGISSGTRQFTFCYSQVPIQTSLGDGYTEYSDTASMLSAIVLPDGTMWQLSYNTYGDIAQIDLPTGGYISYTYNTTSDAFDGYYIRTVASRTVSDGVHTPAPVWTYQISGSGGGTATDPSGNESVSTATTGYPQNPSISQYVVYPYITSIQYLSGSSTTLKTVTKNWSAMLDPYNPTGYLLLPTGETTTLPNNQVSQWSQSYDSGFTYTDGSVNYTVPYGLITATDYYDWGNNAPGSLLSVKSIGYYAFYYSGYFGANLLDLPAWNATYDGNGNLYANTSYQYDQSSPLNSGISTQHTTAPSSVRGNLSYLSQQINGSNYATSYKTVYDTGMVQQVTDANGNSTTYSYNADFAGAYPTTVCNALNQCTTDWYDSNTGVLTWTTDPNNQTTRFTYDNMLRSTQITYPDGGETTFSYPSPTLIEEQKKIGTSAWTNSWYQFDGLGRLIRQANANGESNPDNQMDTCYDGVGNIAFQSYAYQGPGFTQAACSTAGDTFTHDALRRVTQVTHSDGSTILFSYSGRATSVTDESGNERISQADGLGRVTSVCEVAGAQLGTGGTPSACGQDIGGTGFLTTYAYDAMNNLLSVSQGGYLSRSFTYDSLSRLLSAYNPESGTTAYTYDNNGNVITRTRPAPNQTNPAVTVTTTYYYDALNRLDNTIYSDGTTPSVWRAYDQSSVWGSTVNGIGRLTLETTYSGSTDYTAIVPWNFDPMGRPQTVGSCLPPNCAAAYVLGYTYDLLGDITSSTNGLGVSLTNTYNVAQRLTSVTSSLNDANHPGLLYSGVHYNAAGAVTSAAFGNSGSSLNETRTYDGRLRPTGIVDGAPSPVYQTYPGYTANGNLFSSNDSANGYWVYGYDALNRLASASATGQSYTYAYDRFGNRWQQVGSNSMYETFSGNNNRMDGYSYDAAGNLLSDGTSTYTYDAENRIISAYNQSYGATTYVYDAEGRRVQKTTGGVTSQYLYDLGGHEIAAIGIRDEIYAGGRHIATYANSTTYFNLADQLGTERTRATVSGSTWTVAETCTSLPFGDWLQCSGSDSSPMHFTGYERDSESGLDNASARYFGSPLGRFMTPDPAGMLAADPTNPQSWNMYAYALNNPLRYVDPTGTDPGDDSGEDCDPGSGNCLNEAYQWAQTLPIQSQDLSQLAQLNCLNSDCTIINQQLTVTGTGGCQMSDTLCQLQWQQLQQQLQAPTWLLQAKVFLSTLGQNFVNEFKQGGCFHEFADNFNSSILDPSNDPHMDDAIHNVTTSGAYTAALVYAASRGLTVPMRSSVVRGILQAGEKVAGAATLALTDVAMQDALNNEVQSLNAGTCK